MHLASHIPAINGIYIFIPQSSGYGGHYISSEQKFNTYYNPNYP